MPNQLLSAKRLTETAKLPTKAHDTDAGIDLYSDEDLEIKPGSTVLVSTGISMAIPDGHAGLIWDRSSMGVKGLHRFAGVVDSGYRGEVKVCISNIGYGRTEWPFDNKSYFISRGDKIAQILIQEVPNFRIEEVNDLDSTDRGEGGFGSSGK